MGTMNALTYQTAETPTIQLKSVNNNMLKVHSRPLEDGINHEAFRQMEKGQLPDLREFCLTLVNIMRGMGAPTSAREFVDILESLPVLDESEIKGLLEHSVSRHVLVSGDRLEVVLNHWKPTKASHIHGHPSGGCLFKLLCGKAEEVRYAPHSSGKLLGFASYRAGDMGYIDNEMAHHQVGNPYGRPAVSIHIYLK